MHSLFLGQIEMEEHKKKNFKARSSLGSESLQWNPDESEND